LADSQTKNLGGSRRGHQPLCSLLYSKCVSASLNSLRRAPPDAIAPCHMSKPDDPELSARIESTAALTCISAVLEASLREQRAGDSGYSFLAGGEGCEYYDYCKQHYAKQAQADGAVADGEGPGGGGSAATAPTGEAPAAPAPAEDKPAWSPDEPVPAACNGGPGAAGAPPEASPAVAAPNALPPPQMVPPPAMSAGPCADYGFGGYGGMSYPGYSGAYGCGYGCGGYGDGGYGCGGYGGIGFGGGGFGGGYGCGYGGAGGYGGGGCGGGGGGAGFGPYRAVGDVSRVDSRRVEAMLAEREELRRARNFDAADGVRQALMGMGVRVDDKDRTWTARQEGEAGGGGAAAVGGGGGAGGGAAGGGEAVGAGGGGGTSHGYARVPGDSGSCDVEEVRRDTGQGTGPLWVLFLATRRRWDALPHAL
jgi:hypothetical protein